MLEDDDPRPAAGSPTSCRPEAAPPRPRSPELLRHGLTAAGRYLAFRATLPDRPGSLAELLADLADLGANVLEVGHERLAPRLHVDEVEVVLQVETRGPEHCAEVIAALRAAGYTLAFA